MTAAAYTENNDPVSEALVRTATRFSRLVARGRLEDAEVEELALLSANAAHLLAYAEGNQRHLGPARPLQSSWQRLLADPETDAALLALLESSVCTKDTAERTRCELLSWLRERANTQRNSTAAEVAAGYRQARDALDSVDEAQAALLERLGLRTRGATPAAVFSRAVGTTAEPSTREKLVRAWEALRARHTGSVLEQLNAVLSLRREQARAVGASSVVERTLHRSAVDEAQAAAFIDAYLERAVDSTERLAARIRQTIGATDHPLAHFNAYARTVAGTAMLPAFPLDGCLDYLAAVTREVVDIALTPLASDRQGEHLVLGTVGGRAIGIASFDLMETPPRGSGVRAAAASVPTGADRTEELPATLPEARVLCRYQHDARGRPVVTFASLHSMLHEFGHVVNHWLLRRHTPSDTGLDYLPVERIEDLSTWFEKWAYHPRLAEHLNLTAEDAAGLDICSRIKRLEFCSANLDRAVVAALDFDVHRQDSGGYAESFRQLERRFQLGGLCRLGTVAGYLLSPLCRAYPGASFTYAWGAAFGAQAFAPWLRTGPGGCAPPRARADRSLGPCFDPDAPSKTPELDPLFLFYDASGEPCL
ncbi:M3 family metallopeptidase [Streptomyces sp. N2A]|uniref:M3 family metallopeptidase n=1 Tax=Streptomyces sp. N2A TaxID=3073936 RepID=UPI0028700C48|nr:M3 family metallopeptidase [Streptomyces sp. N2A]